MIKCSGYRISPTEVEDIVFESGLVENTVAFGIEDESLGQTVHVAANAKDGGSLDVDTLTQYCRKNMPNYMIPAKFHVWTGSMPRTASGKIDRPSVIEECKKKL